MSDLHGEQAQEILRPVEKVVRRGGHERFTGIETPGDSGDRDARLLRGFHVAQLIPDVEQLLRPQREGLADGFQVLGLAGELGSGGDEVKLVAKAVGTQEQIDIGGRVGSEDAEAADVAAELDEDLAHARDQLEFRDVSPHQSGAAGDEGGHAALRDLEVIEQVLKRKVAEPVEFVLGHFADAVVRSDAVEDAAGLAQGVGDGAVEVENNGFINHNEGIS